MTPAVLTGTTPTSAAPPATYFTMPPLPLCPVLLPATTALSSISENGREEGLKAGGNVIMPNLSPMSVRKKYSLYDNKAYILDEDAQYKKMIEEKLKKVGFEIEITRGDNPDFVEKL